MPQLEFGTDALTIGIAWAEDRPPEVVRWRSPEVDIATPGVPAVEVMTPSSGHASPVQVMSRTLAGSRLRYQDHQVAETATGTRLTVDLTGPDGFDVRWELSARHGVSAITSTVTVINSGAEPLDVAQAASLSCAVSRSIDADDLHVITGTNDWVGENRWHRRPLRDDVVALSSSAHVVAQKAGLIARSFGSWSTARDLPVGVLVAEPAAYAIGWQIEHNGAWRWEVTEDESVAVLTLSGPTDLDHQWLARLEPGESFTSVPVTVSVASTWEGAIGALTDHRRAARRAHPDNQRQTLIFNDYMNTLLGDPTTEKLLPLVESAADAGAEVFCIDAGWYDDGTDWWPSVGAWQPSTTRFPNGLQEIIAAITARGMVPGLWLEPEVVGVRSPMAEQLPDEAFLLRRGRRVVEAERYHLDLRHPAAREHLDRTVDRLVGDLGVGMFKLDYNVNPGAGTDHDAASPGVGLLGHQRALLDWLDGLYDRYPDLIMENCGSGAMRSDFAMLSRLNLQSTSDQQDTAAYAPIAAAAPMIMLPEQAGSWAYPAADMTLEETATTLQAGLLGRLYLSGYLHRLRPEQLALVHEAMSAHRALRTEILHGRPSWPLGLPAWQAQAFALALRGPSSTLLTVWHRGPGATTIDVPLGPDRTRIEPVFPTTLPGWQPAVVDGLLRLAVPGPGPAARTYRLLPI